MSEITPVKIRDAILIILQEYVESNKEGLAFIEVDSKKNLEVLRDMQNTETGAQEAIAEQIEELEDTTFEFEEETQAEIEATETIIEILKGAEPTVEFLRESLAHLPDHPDFISRVLGEFEISDPMKLQILQLIRLDDTLISIFSFVASTTDKLRDKSFPLAMHVNKRLEENETFSEEELNRYNEMCCGPTRGLLCRKDPEERPAVRKTFNVMASFTPTLLETLCSKVPSIQELYEWAVPQQR